MSHFNYKPPDHFLVQKRSGKYGKQPAKKSKSVNEFEETAKHLALEFGRKSTIHAMNRIFQEHSNIYERFFWLLTLVLALLGCIYVCLILSQRFSARSLQTVVETTKKPVFQIPFPEVTICNENRLNWDRIEEAKERFMPNESNTERLRLFERVIGLYDNLEYGVFNAFNQLKGEKLHLVNNINFSLVYEFMTWHCEELLTNCLWHSYPVNCCEIFLKSKNLAGLCWHFNTLSTEEGRTRHLADDKYPWRIGSAGPKSGLALRVLIHDDKHYRKSNEKGILVSVTEPNVFHKAPLWIPANTEAAVQVDPVIYFYDNGTRRTPTTSRLCLFTDERSETNVKYLADFPYMFENCEAQCRQEYLLKYCNCTMDLLFPPDKYPSCRAEDLLCLAKYNEYFRFTYQIGEEEYVRKKVQGMVCKCFRNCYSLRYNTDVRPSFLPDYVRSNITYTDLDVHFRLESMMVYRTSLVFSWIDLMVAFGGIAGLFLGCSLISGIELIYFSLVELPAFMYHKLQLKGKQTDKSGHTHHDHRQHTPRKHSNWVTNNRIGGVQNTTATDFGSHQNNLNRNLDNQLQYFLGK